MIFEETLIKLRVSDIFHLYLVTLLSSTNMLGDENCQSNFVKRTFFWGMIPYSQKIVRLKVEISHYSVRIIFTLLHIFTTKLYPFLTSME